MNGVTFAPFERRRYASGDPVWVRVPGRILGRVRDRGSLIVEVSLVSDASLFRAAGTVVVPRARVRSRRSSA